MGDKSFTGAANEKGLQSLNGGLNSTSSALGVNDNEATDLQNVDFDVFGSIKKRNGYAQLNESAANGGQACTGLYYAEFLSGDLLVGAFEDKIYKMDSLDGTFDAVTLSGSTITSGANLLCDMTLFVDRLFITNNTDNPMQWFGTGGIVDAVVPTGLTKAKFVVTWNNYLFYFNVTVSGTSHPSRGYWCTIKNPDIWSSLSFIDVSQNDGQEISGVKPLGDRLVIFKERSIYYWVFTGDSDIPFVSIKTPSDVGCASGFSIQEVENGLLFRSFDGYYFFDGNDSVKASDKITTTLNTYAKNRLGNTVSAYQRSKNRYWCAETTNGGSTNDRVVIFDNQNTAWSIYTGDSTYDLAINAIIVCYVNGEERVYFGDYNGYVYRADTGTNDNPQGNEVAVDAYWKSKWFNFGDIYSEKSSSHIMLYWEISSSTLTIGHSYDLDVSDQYRKTKYLGTSASVYDTATYDTDIYAVEGGKVERVDLAGRGRSMRLSFYNNVLGETFQINGIGFQVALETDV